MIVVAFIVLEGGNWHEAQRITLEWPSLKDPGARVELWPTFIRTPDE